MWDLYFRYIWIISRKRFKIWKIKALGISFKIINCEAWGCGRKVTVWIYVGDCTFNTWVWLTHDAGCCVTSKQTDILKSLKHDNRFHGFLSPYLGKCFDRTDRSVWLKVAAFSCEQAEESIREPLFVCVLRSVSWLPWAMGDGARGRDCQLCWISPCGFMPLDITVSAKPGLS